MKESLRQRARELGFDDCRVTTANPPESAACFKQWLAERQHGEMTYLERNAPKRVDPQHVLPGARSIITLAASYHNSSWKSGPIARYARYHDYHDILGERLRQLAEFVCQLGGESTRCTLHASDGGEQRASCSPSPPLEERIGERRPITLRDAAVRGDIPAGCRTNTSGGLAENDGLLSLPLSSEGGEGNGAAPSERRDASKEQGTRSLWYVDTGPLLERDLAQRAGLGFIGKHTNLISRQLGNWLFLSEIITTLDLEPDAPEKNRCGSCTRCITACPTSAITAPFQLDARRCISYLTIELKGSIPVELRPAIGNRIFGCDDCLQVCPWNRFAREGQMMKAHARPDLAQPDLVELLSLEEGGFKRRFAGTPMLRAKRRGLLRNVCVALGNIGDEKALPALQEAESDHEPLVAEHATWAIEQIQIRSRRLR
jgi:epoxyqueuosine reductase QueG